MSLKIYLKSFSFRLKKSLHTSNGFINQRNGWLIRIESGSDLVGWGEISPLCKSKFDECGKLLEKLNKTPTRRDLEDCISLWPAPLGFGFGAALAELDSLVGSKTNGWLQSPKPAFLVSAKENLLAEIESVIEANSFSSIPLTLKIKVGFDNDRKEQELVNQACDRLPKNTLLRLDPNGSWNWERANNWIDKFLNDRRIQWFEQPLPAEEIQGLIALSERAPIALDESLFLEPSLRDSWKSWQVRRPLLEGDPRPLLRNLEHGIANISLSTGFETGIGFRWVSHLAALQHKGPTPVAPGLAPGWLPEGDLFSENPLLVWEAAQ